MALAIALVVSAFGTAFAAAGDMIGLTDLATYDGYRPNVYDVDIGSYDTYELEIYPLIDNGSGVGEPGWFTSAAAADPSNFIWTPQTAVYGNFDIDLGSGAAVEASSGHWYYSVTLECYGYDMGPEGWRAAYTPVNTASGDFFAVATDQGSPDSGSTFSVGIEFYDSDPVRYTPFAVGMFNTVSGGDDYATDNRGRSYPTVLDAVAHGTLPPGNIISTYHKKTSPTPKAMLEDVVDTNGNYHQGNGRTTGWMYAVYYQNETIQTQYDRDPDSRIEGADEYEFRGLPRKGQALVIWAIGAINQYDSFFPTTITRN
jgi:hypothetical protein